MSSPAAQLSQSILRASAPLGPYGVPIAAAALLLGVGASLLAAFELVNQSRGAEKAAAWKVIYSDYYYVWRSDLARQVMESEGIDPDLAEWEIPRIIQAEISATLPPLNLPTFGNLLDLDQWLAGWTRFYNLGVVPESWINQVRQWYDIQSNALRRAAAPSAPAPAAPTYPLPYNAVWPPAGVIPGAFTTGYLPNLGRWMTRDEAIANGLISAAPTTAPPRVIPVPPAPTVPTVPLAPSPVAPYTIFVNPPAISIPPTTVNVAPAPVTVIPQPAPQVLIPGLEQLAPLLGALPMGLVRSLGLTANPQLSPGGNWGHQTQLARYGCMGSFLGPLLDVGMRLAPQIAAGALLATDNPIRQRLDALVTEIISKEIDPSRFVVPASYEAAVANASSRLTQAVGFGLQAQAIAYTAEAMTPLKQIGFSQLAGFFGELAGFGRIAAGLMGTLENAAIYRPLMWEANKRFRPNIPDDKQLTLMFQKRSLSREELSDYQERLGLPDLYIDRLPGFIFNDPNPGLLIRAFQVAEPGKVTFSEDDKAIMARAGIDPQDPDAYFKLKFAKSGLDDTDVQAFVPVVKMGILRREQTIRFEQINRLYRDGFIDEARAGDLIDAARQPTDVKTYRLAAMSMMRDYEVLTSTRSVILMAMSRGLLTRDEARQQLTRLGMPGQRVELEVLKATLGMIPGVRISISRPEEVLEEVEGV